MNETQPLPTDAEIDALLRPFYESDDAAEMAKYDDRLTARAVLAKWGTPQAVAGEPVGWMWQHEETGRTGFVDCWQVENGWQENNPRLRLVSKLYTTPQPTQAQAGAVPLTAYQIHEAIKAFKDSENLMGVNHIHVARAIERAHGIGIKGGQHAE